MSEKEFICPECGKSFDTPQGLGAHRARSHSYRRDASAHSLEDYPRVQNLTADLTTTLETLDGELVRLAREVERLERELSLAVQTLIDALETVAN